MLAIGCDPGLTGALALLDSDRGLLEVVDVPTCANGQTTGSMKRWVDVEALADQLRTWSRTHEFALHSVVAAVERPIPMPSLPAQTVASQFDTFGAIRALLRRYADVRHPDPQVWKKRFGFGRDKDEARACALRLYPGAPLTRVKDHNRAESVLIGHWLLKEMA